MGSTALGSLPRKRPGIPRRLYLRWRGSKIRRKHREYYIFFSKYNLSLFLFLFFALRSLRVAITPFWRTGNTRKLSPAVIRFLVGPLGALCYSSSCCSACTVG